MNRESYSARQSRKAREENQRIKHGGCNHDSEHWCGRCINIGTEVDWREYGLGKGHIISNLPINGLTNE